MERWAIRRNTPIRGSQVNDAQGGVHPSDGHERRQGADDQQRGEGINKARPNVGTMLVSAGEGSHRIVLLKLVARAGGDSARKQFNFAPKLLNDIIPTGRYFLQ